MFDTHRNGHHRLTYYAHGPEWAFVIPDGDDHALRDVVKVSSRAWNGAGALILVADDAGRLRADCKRYIDTRFIDETWLHPSLTVAARDTLKAEVALSPVDWDVAERVLRALHPAELVSPPALSEHRMSMSVPEFSTTALRHMAAIAWGVVEYPHEWRDRFDVGKVGTDLAFVMLVGGQLGFNMVSPLRVSQLSMEAFGRLGEGQPWPYLWVFESCGFDELVAFWNFRSAASTRNRLASVVGIPREALARPRMLEALKTWALSSTDTSLMPTVLAHVSPDTVPKLEEALAAVGIDPLNDEEPRREDSPPEKRRLTWLPREPVPNGRILRGAWDDVALSVYDGQALVTLPRPRGYHPSGGARLVLQALPTPLPITPTAATRMSLGAFAHPRGLGINMATGSPWSIDLQLPDERSALQDWAGDHGYTIEEPRAGTDARALLQRLGDLQRLDALVDELRLEVLAKLAPLAREQLVKKLSKEFAPPGDRETLAEELIEKLREEGLLLEPDGRTLEQLESALSNCKTRLGFDRHDLVAALSPLVEAGFVQRGRNVECPRCRFGAFLALRELDEHVRCRGCSAAYPLPVYAASGDESPTAYRLDGLMARVMERHVLPVILTLRALRDPARYQRPNHIWPGMLFHREGENPFEVDLLASDRNQVFAAECKLDGRGLETAQLNKLLAFTDRVDATPVVAAVAGNFHADIRNEIETRGGLVLERKDLLTIGSPPDLA